MRENHKAGGDLGCMGTRLHERDIQRASRPRNPDESLGARGRIPEYYQLTGKPLGITGEVAEYVAAEILKLELAPPRTSGFGAIRKTDAGDIRIQIRGEPSAKDRSAASGWVRSRGRTMRPGTAGSARQ